MKILQVINSFATGGAEKLLLESLPIYQTKNCHVDLLLLNGNNKPFLELLEEKNCCSIFKLSNGSVYNPLIVFKILPFLKKYDIIHVHLFPALYWVALAKMISFSKVKLIYTEHNTNNRRRELIYFKILDKIIYYQYSKIVAITEEVKDLLLSHLGNNFSKKMNIINNGINLKSIYESMPYSKNEFFEEKSIICIQVSRFHPQKNQKIVIEAISKLPEKFKLLLVGEGELKEECINYSKSLKIDNRVKFLGNRNDVPKLLKTSDIVVLSSNFEGLSLSCIEGLASGKPFVGSNVPGIKNIVENYGVLFEKNNSQQLSNIILNLTKNKQYNKKIAQQCLERSSFFSIIKMTESYVNIFKSLQ